MIIRNIVSQKYVGNITYFNDIVKSCFNDEVGREFFMYLLTYDISDYHPNDIPMTDFKRQLKSKNLDPIIKSIIDHMVKIIKLENIDINDNLKLEALLSKENGFFVCDLYDTYLTLFSNNNKSKPTNNRGYSAKIKSMLQIDTIVKYNTIKKNSLACINITMKDLENKIKCFFDIVTFPL